MSSSKSLDGRQEQTASGQSGGNQRPGKKKTAQQKSGVLGKTGGKISQTQTGIISQGCEYSPPPAISRGCESTPLHPEGADSPYVEKTRSVPHSEGAVSGQSYERFISQNIEPVSSDGPENWTVVSRYKPRNPGVRDPKSTALSGGAQARPCDSKGARRKGKDSTESGSKRRTVPDNAADGKFKAQQVSVQHIDRSRDTPDSQTVGARDSRKPSADDKEEDLKISAIKEIIRGLQAALKTIERHERLARRAIVSQDFQRQAERDFPKLGQEAYSVPPCLMGLSGLYTKQNSDIEGHTAESIVVRNFMALNTWFAKNQKPAMFIMTSYCLDNLLGWLGPRGQSKLGKEFVQICREVFSWDICNIEAIRKVAERHETDLIVLHRDKGIFFVEVKAVGGKDESKNRETIKKTMDKAVKSLDKDTRILSRLMSNSPCCNAIKMRRVVALANLRRAELGVSPGKDVILLCKDDLMCCADVTKPDAERDLSAFRRWWDKLPTLPSTGDVSWMKEILGKYVGPLSWPVREREGNQQHLLLRLADVVRYVAAQQRNLLQSSGAGIAPGGLEQRCPNSVLQLLYHVEGNEEQRQEYKKKLEERGATEGAGLPPLCVRHDRHDRGVKVTECRQCALELADLLREQRLVLQRPDTLSASASFSPGETVSVPQNFGGARPKEVRKKNAATSTRAKRRNLQELPGAPAAGDFHKKSSPETLTPPTGRSENVSDLVIMFSHPQHSDTVAPATELSDQGCNRYVKYLATCPFITALQEEGIPVEVWSGEDSGGAVQGNHKVLASCVHNFRGGEWGVVTFVPSEKSSQMQEPRPGAEGGAVSQARGVETVAEMTWETRDIDSFRSCDRTNMAAAAERCLALLILIVP